MIQVCTSIHKTPCVTKLKPVCFISAGSWSTTAHFVVDTPPTSIVCLETLTAAVGWIMHSHYMYMGISLMEAHIINSRVARAHTYLAADAHLVTVKAPTLVAKGIPTSELRKLKSVTARNIEHDVLTFVPLFPARTHH